MCSGLLTGQKHAPRCCLHLSTFAGTALHSCTGMRFGQHALFTTALSSQDKLVYVPSLPGAPKDAYAYLPDRFGLNYEVCDNELGLVWWR